MHQVILCMKNNAPQPAQLEHNEAPTLIEIPAQEACNESKAAVTPARPDGDNKVAIVRTHASQKIIELIALGVAACILLVSVYPHVSKSSGETTHRSPDVQLKLSNRRTRLNFP